MVRFTRMYRHYLLSRKFIVRTDHHSLIWLMSFRCPQDHLARWQEELSQYHMVKHHRAGCRHCNADALSRLPVPFGGCGGCPKRTHSNWNTLTKEVDDVGLLSKSSCWSYDPDMAEYYRVAVACGLWIWFGTVAPCHVSWTSRSRDARKGRSVPSFG